VSLEKSLEEELLRCGILVMLIFGKKMALHLSSLLTTRQSSMSNLVRNNLQLVVIQIMDQSLEMIFLLKITATLPQITSQILDMLKPYQQVCHMAQMNQNLTLQEVTYSK
jgi:hypothetical protein